MKPLLRTLAFYQLLSVAITLVFRGTTDFWRALPAIWIVTNCISLSIHGLFVLIARRSPYVKWNRWRLVALAVPVVAAGSFIGVGAASLILQLVAGESLLAGELFVHLDRAALPVAALVTTLILGYYILQDRITTEALEAERLRGLQARAELAALRSKLDPHFLFNTLNTMLNLVHKEPDRVEEMILGLSDIYRKILRLPEAGTIPLGEEFALAEQYLRIEATRLGERLDFRLELPPELAAMPVPPLLVQPLVENAVVHGIGPRPRGGVLRLTARKEADAVRIEVYDDGVGLAAGAGRTGFGLHSVRERMRLRYGEAGRVSLEPASGGGTVVTLVVPREP